MPLHVSSRCARNMWRHEIKLIVKQNFCASSWLITEINSKSMYSGLGYYMTTTFVNLASLLKLYQSLYRPLGLQEVRVPRISRQSAYENGKVAFTLQEISLVLISLKRWVDSTCRVLPEGLNQLTPSRIGPANFRVVGQCLNQLRRRHSSSFIPDRGLWNAWC